MRNKLNSNRSLIFDSELQFDYEPIKEAQYTFEHPLVIEQTNHFISQAKDKNIFKNLHTTTYKNKKKTALVVSSCWHQFSTIMPQMLCFAAFKVKSNLLRHYIIQVPFEELGMRNVNEIHPDLFAEAQKSMNLGKVNHQIKIKSINQLKKTLFQKNINDSYILGFLLGLEIPGQENIATVLNCMSFNELASKRLRKTKFFRIHQSIEIEHIRLNTSNYLRFCKSKKEKSEFQKGFNKGLLFWEKFWLEVAELCV